MPTGERESRIRRRIEQYRLVGMGADLESQWTHTYADIEPRAALEALTDYFNTAIVNAVFAQTGDEPADYRAEEVYRILVDDEAPSADETAVRAWLGEHDVDPEVLTGAFVTPRAIHRYLRDERGLEIPVPLEHPPEVAQHDDVTADDLDGLIRHADTPQHEDRLRFIRHLYDGTIVPEAAEVVGYHPSTGYRWLRAWEEGGIEGLLTDFEPGWRKLTPRQERRFVDHLATDDRWAIDDIRAFLAEEFDVSYDDRHLHRKLRGYGLEKIHLVDVFRWPADAPDDPDARRRAAFDDGERSPAGIDDGRDAAD